ncbi:MAG: hypothetical protein IPM58_00835 [Nitrospira sp.]|nr:hypothetical protein [Nitrospira sp.]
MPITRLSIEPLKIPFKQAFVHASAVRAETESVLVTVTNANRVEGVGEGCPRHYVTGETVDSIERFIDIHREQWMAFASVHDLKNWASLHSSVIDQNPAAWCAVETAFLDVFGKEAGVPIEGLLGYPPLSGLFQYSAVLGTDSSRSFKKQLERYLAAGFTDFKVKVTGRLQDDCDKLERWASREDSPIRVRLDANNLWSDAQGAFSYLK